MSEVFFHSLIPSLDRMFRSDHKTDAANQILEKCPGIVLRPMTDGEKRVRTIQMALAGPAGTGKSVLALHYAAGFKYFNPDSIVIYISTDLSQQIADKQFQEFGLHSPESLIQFPLANLLAGTTSKYPSIYTDGIEAKGGINPAEDPVHLVPVQWGQAEKEWLKIIKSRTNEAKPGIHFLDLQSGATGDDWAYLERFFTSTLPLLAHARDKILIVVDAVEGLDATPGEFDGADVRHKRRQRLAKLLESTSGLAHVIYTLESGDESDESADEEFVADIVMRLRRQERGDTRRHTLEITKARGMVTEPGIHHLVVRDGTGTFSFEQVNIDDQARTVVEVDNQGNKKTRHRSYVQIYPSLSWVEEGIERSKTAVQSAAQGRIHKFCIDGLDNMLARDTGGLPAGRVYALVGEVDTFKSRLARSFLRPILTNALASRTNQEYVGLSQDEADLPPGIACLFRGGRSLTSRAIHSEVINHLCRGRQEREQEREATLPAWQILAGEKASDTENQPDQKERRLFYRRLPNRSVSAEQLYAIIRENLLGAILNQIAIDESEHDFESSLEDTPEALTLRLLNHFPDVSYEGAWKIRVVMDDLSAVLATYGLTDQSDLIVPALVDLFRLAGVTAILVDSHVGGPLDMSLAGSRSMLRSRVDHSLFTWKVPYGSGSKVAIAALPPISGGQNVVVRELKVNENDCLAIDRSLELYLDVLPSQAQKDAGLRRVPLHLVVASDGAVWSDGTLQAMCEELLRQTLGNADDAFSNNRNLIRVTQVPRAKLETYVGYNDMSAEAETVVAMVDEYWVRKPIRRNEVESRFLPIQYQKLKERIITQYDRELVKGQGNTDLDKENVDPTTQLVQGLVPFTWNFGLMMIRRNPWQQLQRTLIDTEEIKSKDPKLPHRIEVIVEKLSNKIDWIEQKLDDPYEDEKAAAQKDIRHIRNNTMVFWHEFLHACHLVAQRYSLRYDRDPLKPYELDLTDGQSLTSLVLEVWLSTAVWIRVFATDQIDEANRKDIERLSKGRFQQNTQVHHYLETEEFNGTPNEVKNLTQDIFHYWSQQGDHRATLFPDDIQKDTIATELNLSKVREAVEIATELWSETDRDEHSPVRRLKSIYLGDVVSRRNCEPLNQLTAKVCQETLDFFESISMAEIVVLGLRWIKDLSPPLEKEEEHLAPDQKNQLRLERQANFLKSYLPNSSTDKQEAIGDLNRCGELVVALYLTVVMLSESIDFESWELDESSHTFKGKPSLGNAVAGRYWYTSACQMLRAKTPDGQSVYDPADPFLPMGLPGVFSTRGDWYLAILRSSRSHYLGELAIDQLSRSKAVSARMQSGLGLPPFSMTEQPNASETKEQKEDRLHNDAEVYRRVRTAFPSPSGGRLATFSYQYFREIAPISDPENNNNGFFGHSNCYAIHRSRIKNYLDEHNLFLKGICRLITSFEDIKRRTGWAWKDFPLLFEQLEHFDDDFFERIRKRPEGTKLDKTGQRITGLQTWKEFSSYFWVFFSLVPHEEYDEAIEEDADAD